MDTEGEIKIRRVLYNRLTGEIIPLDRPTIIDKYTTDVIPLFIEIEGKVVDSRSVPESRQLNEPD